MGAGKDEKEGRRWVKKGVKKKGRREEDQNRWAWWKKEIRKEWTNGSRQG